MSTSSTRTSSPWGWPARPPSPTPTAAISSGCVRKPKSAEQASGAPVPEQRPTETSHRRDHASSQVGPHSHPPGGPYGVSITALPQDGGPGLCSAGAPLGEADSEPPVALENREDSETGPRPVRRGGAQGEGTPPPVRLPRLKGVLRK